MRGERDESIATQSIADEPLLACRGTQPQRRVCFTDDAGEPAHLVDRFGELGQSGQRLAVEPARQFIRP